MFPNAMPLLSNWKPLRANAYVMNWPQASESANVRIGDEEENKEWRKIPLFESVETADHITFFVGGPSWSAAWCPTPVDQKEENQYLAIATCVNFDTFHPLYDEETELGLLQFWNCGLLTTSRGERHSGEGAKLAMGVAHSYGVIWGMEWCPFGNTWQSSDVDNDGTNLPRLGLLALACGDGVVRILSVPYPESIPLGKLSHLICSPEPVITLDPPGVGPAINFEPTICKSVSWSSTNCNLVAAGYARGVVAVWDLATKSPLLLVNQKDVSRVDKIILPRFSWLAHSSCVSSLKFCPYPGEDYLATAGSLDRDLKIWDLTDLACPLRVGKRSAITAIDWNFQWNGLVVAYDEGFNHLYNPVYFKDICETGDKSALSSHKSCVWVRDQD